MDAPAIFNSRLPLPTLIVPGGSAHQDGLPNLWHYLTDGGANQYGGSWSASGQDAFVAGSSTDNVYNIHYSETFGTYSHNAQEVQKAIDAIRQRTGAPEVNVVAQCKGAEEVRELLRQGGHDIRNLVLLTPMNHGLPLSGELVNILVSALELLHVPLPKIDAPYLRDIFTGHKDADTEQALKELASDGMCFGIHKNRALEQLNTPENMAHERQAVHSLTVLAGEGQKLGAPFGVSLPFKDKVGDGAISEADAFMPEAENFYFPVQHANETNNVDLLAKVAETLMTDGHPQHDRHFRASLSTVSS